MKPINEAKVEFLSRSANEGLCPGERRPALPPRLDPTLEELGDIKTAVGRRR